MFGRAFLRRRQISPTRTNLGDVSNSRASAMIRFANITNGGSTASDAINISTPSEGKTVTLNGQTFTFRASPVDPVTDIQFYRRAAHANFDLMLSGHTHGGQICLPGSIPIKLEAVLPRRMGAGA